MKKLVLLALVFALIFTGCSGWNVEIKDPESGSESSVPESGSETEIAPEEPDPLSYGLISFTRLDYTPFTEKAADDSSPAAEFSETLENIVIYIYDSNELGYRGFYYPKPEESVTLLQLVTAVAARIESCAANDMFTFSARREKSMTIVDISEKTEGAFAALDDENTLEELLNSIAQTVAGNTGNTIGFTMNGGGQFKTAGLELEANGYGGYDPAPLYSEISDEDFTAIRALCKYPETMREGAEIKWFCGEKEAEGFKELLYYAGETGKFASAKELSDEKKIKAAIEMLPCVEGYAEYENYVEGIGPLCESVGDFELIPREWVETAVKQLFGPEAEVTRHTETNHWKFHAKEGVYTSPHMGGGVIVTPCVMSFKETESGYEAEVTYLTQGMGGYKDENDEWIEYPVKNGYLVYENVFDNPEVTELIENRLTRYTVEITKGSDGSLYISSVK